MKRSWATHGVICLIAEAAEAEVYMGANNSTWSTASGMGRLLPIRSNGTQTQVASNKLLRGFWFTDAVELTSSDGRQPLV